MARDAKGYGMLLIALLLALYPARAGDRKSAAQDRQAFADIANAREVRSIFQRQDGFASSALRPFEARYAAQSFPSAKAQQLSTPAATPATEHKPLTLFNINSKLGSIAVQPVVGPVKGAQFSIGF